MKQETMFEKDPLDPQLAKVADRYVELLIEKKRNKEAVEIQGKNLIGLMNKAKKLKIRHGGKVIELARVEERSKLKVKDQKPKKVKKPR